MKVKIHQIVPLFFYLGLFLQNLLSGDSSSNQLAQVIYIFPSQAVCYRIAVYSSNIRLSFTFCKYICSSKIRGKNYS